MASTKPRRGVAVAFAVAAAFTWSAVASGDASAQTPCAPDAASSTCVVLDDCYVIGSIRMTAPPLESLGFYRTCLFTDHRWQLEQTDAGRRATRRTRLRKIYESTFWPLYCYAVRRAGQSDRSICDRRANNSRRSKRGSARRVPSFTG